MAKLAAFGLGALDRLVVFLDHRDPKIRTAAARAMEFLAQGGGNSPDRRLAAMPLRTEEGDAASAALRAAEAMWRMGSKDHIASALLGWVLSEANVEQRLHAAELLANMGRSAEPALPALVACLVTTMI